MLPYYPDLSTASDFPPTPPDHTELPLFLYTKAHSSLLWIYDELTMLISFHL